MIDTLEFKDYAPLHKIERRVLSQGYYDYNRVQQNFYNVIDTLGSFDKNDFCAAITLRLKNRVKVKKVVDSIETHEYIKTDWRTANSVAKALRFKISAKYWGRKGRKHNKMPMARAIEADKNWFKEHLHILVRFTDLKQYHDENSIESFIRDTCDGFNEINERDKTAVHIRMFRYWNQTNELGNTIEYMCKTTSSKYDPLAEN